MFQKCLTGITQWLVTIQIPIVSYRLWGMGPGNMYFYLFLSTALGHSCCQAGLENTVHSIIDLHWVPNRNKDR